MNILLTNDDGVDAPGLSAIHSRLSELGKVVVVAPLLPQSGMSHSITFTEPVTCRRIEGSAIDGYAVAGTPADCVKLACGRLDIGPFDLLVSGINRGANVGLNVCYSGTVAAALEGSFKGIPAVALSLADEDSIDFDAAASYAVALLHCCLSLAKRAVLNINIPRLSQGEPKGIRVVPQSMLGFQEHFVPRGEGPNLSFQISGGPPYPDGAMTDTMALSAGYVTVTPLHGDLTKHELLEDLASILPKSLIDRPSDWVAR